MIIIIIVIIIIIIIIIIMIYHISNKMYDIIMAEMHLFFFLYRDVFILCSIKRVN